MRASGEMRTAEPIDASLLCRVGHLICTLPLAHVIETMRPLPVERVSGLPDYIDGLAIIRGVPRPVVDAARLLTGVPGEPTRYVLVSAEGRQLALAVDAVLDVQAIPRRILHDLPHLIGADPHAVPARVATWDWSLVVVLRAARLVPDGIWAALSSRGAA